MISYQYNFTDFTLISLIKYLTISILYWFSILYLQLKKFEDHSDTGKLEKWHTCHIFFIFTLPLFNSSLLIAAYSSLSSMSSSLSSPAISPRNISPVNPTENSPNIGERFESASRRNYQILILPFDRFIQHVIRSHGTRSSCTGLREEIAGNGCATKSCSFRLRAEKALGYESDTNEAGY